MFEQFKLLKQTAIVNQYYDEYEKCRGLMLCQIPQLTEKYFMDNFIGGDERRDKGLCYYCDEKFVKGHINVPNPEPL